MTWEITVAAQSDSAQQSAAVTLETANRKVTLLSDSTWHLAQDDNAVIALLGRLRPYQQDYFQDKLQQSGAVWFLTQYRLTPAAFFNAIAGFFLLVIFDKKHGTVQVINDHVGSVPCYIKQTNSQSCYISDDVQLIRQHDAALSISPQAIYNYMYFHCIPSPLSLYAEVLKMPPGSCADLSQPGNGRIENYYQPDFTPANESEAQLQRRCSEVISTAVRRNITNNCAAFLSGGLDSSTVAGMLAKHSTVAKTYSIGFDAQGYDETEYALLTARHFNTEHKVHYLQPEDIVENFSSVAASFTEPFGNSSAMAAYICAKVAAQDGIKVMLAGDGGDEIFAGNERYVKQLVFERYHKLPDALQKLLDISFYNPLAAKLPLLKKAHSYINQAKMPMPDRLESYNFLNRFSGSDMFTTAFYAGISPKLPLQQQQQRFLQCKSDYLVDKMMYLDWKFTLADNDLVKVSGMCKKAGVEVRYPLFEKEVVDFSCTVPTDLKLAGGKLRGFYKNSFRGFLPDGTLNKSKHGFGLPFGVWMKKNSELQQIALQALQQFKQRQVLQTDFIELVITTFQSGHSGYYGELVWIIVVIELWLQQHESAYVA